VFGKVFCLYLMLLLFVIIVNVYELLSGMNMKTLDIGKQVAFGICCVLIFAALFHFCNYAHYFVNIVR